MNALNASAVTACVCCIACSVLSMLFPLSVTKKTVSLVMGAFMICSMLIPLIGVISSFSADYEDSDEIVEYDVDYEAQFEKEVLTQTAENLVIVTNDLLSSEKIKPEDIKISIGKSDNNSIYISSIYIYITEQDREKTDYIKNLISRNMSKEPVVIVNE